MIPQARITEWINNNDVNAILDLSNLNLIKLPILPGNLQELNCSNNKLTTLTKLPDTLRLLNCSNNELTTLTKLPDNLQVLVCNNNELTTLPDNLANTLTLLNCSNNQLTTLTKLPDNLQILVCNGNQLTTLPDNLANNLILLNCNRNNLSKLPTLPDSLQELNCNNNELTTLPDLPPNLRILNCSYNYLSELPTLPNNLIKLYCSDNKLSELPSLPPNLQVLHSSDNDLNSLQNLPHSLIELYCSYNDLTLENLPPNLQKLNCSNNQLTTLPTLPPNLVELYCNENELTTLPTLPANLVELNCSYNNLSQLPTLPLNLTSLQCNNNLLTTLQNLPHTLKYLDCSDNELNNLNISKLQNLKDINIAKNYLKLNNININHNDIDIKKQIKEQLYFNYINLQKFNDFCNQNADKCYIKDEDSYLINYTNLTKWRNEILDEPNIVPFLLTDFVYAFSKTLTHIRFKTFYDNACKLGYKIVQLINGFKNQNIVIYNFDISKSNNWVLILIFKILYNLIDNTNRNNIYIMDYTQMNSVNTKIKNPKVIYIDDCGYSGNQIMNIRRYHLQNVKDIYICNVYITDYALTKFNVNKLNVIFEEKLNNFKDKLEEHELKTYNKILQNEYLQKLWLLERSDGICNVYFDHKLASGVSIFQSLLAFGLTPTNNITKSNFNNSYPLISKCENVYTADKIKYINDKLFDLNESLHQKACPVSFYKTIQYTYNNKLIKDFTNLYNDVHEFIQT